MIAAAPGATSPVLSGQQPTTLALLGGFHLVVDGEQRMLTPSGERLVALLALQGPMTRSCAAGTLWPLVPESSALPRLRTCLWRINERAPDVVVATRSTVCLDPRIQVDVRSAPPAGGATQPSHEPTYAGDLLPFWDDDWLLVERERLRQIRLHELDLEATRLVGEGHFGPALAAAYAALGADPYRESALQTILAVHRAEGNGSEAERVHRLLQRLREDASPGPTPPAGGPPPTVPRPRRRR